MKLCALCHHQEHEPGHCEGYQAVLIEPTGRKPGNSEKIIPCTCGL